MATQNNTMQALKIIIFEEMPITVKQQAQQGMELYLLYNSRIKYVCTNACV